MKKPEISYSWLSEPDVDFKTKMAEIIEAMTDNPDFPETDPPLSDVKKVFEDEYAPYVLGPGSNTTTTSDLRKKGRMKLTDLLRLYLPNVQALSKNDLEKLLSTKIPLISVPGEAPLPQTPEGIQLGMHGDPAVLVVKCQAQPNAELYKAQVSEDQENWAWSESSRNASMEIKDLPRGKLLYLRMMMKNINGPSDWSAPISFQIPTSGVVIPRLVKPRRKRA